MNHPPFYTLTDYLAGKLSKEIEQEVEAHLATCSDCQYELGFANRTLNQASEKNAMTPSADLIRRAVAAFRRKQAYLAQRLSIVATLQMDNFTQVAALGARGVAKERQLLYTFDEFDLDLQIDAQNPSTAIALRGQILTHTQIQSGLEGITVRLMNPRYTPWLRLTDELGRFGISGLKAETYSLQIMLEDRDVIVEPLVLPG